MPTSDARHAPSRTEPARWILAVRGVALTAALGGACSIESEPSPELELRDGGCGEGREPGHATQTCTYAVQPWRSTALVQGGTCTGNGMVKCTFSGKCDVSASQTSACRSNGPGCPEVLRPSFEISRSYQLPGASTVCDSQDPERVRDFCSAHTSDIEVVSAFRRFCRGSSIEPHTREVFCCIDKTGAPCNAADAGVGADAVACDVADGPAISVGGGDDAPVSGGGPIDDEPWPAEESSTTDGCTDCDEPVTCAEDQAASCAWDELAEAYDCQCVAAAP